MTEYQEVNCFECPAYLMCAYRLFRYVSYSRKNKVDPQLNCVACQGAYEYLQPKEKTDK